MAIILASAFSLNMLRPGSAKHVRFGEALGLDFVVGCARDGKFEFQVGHPDTAVILGGLLGVPVPCVRGDLSFGLGDAFVVAQYRGPRLPAGATELPPGAEFEFIPVHIEDPADFFYTQPTGSGASEALMARLGD